jgi:hypothetical protein
MTHLNRRAKFISTPPEQVRQILARMLSSSKEQRDAIFTLQAHDARSVQTGALIRHLPHEAQDLNTGVVVVKHLALSRLPDQLLPDRLEHPGGRFDNLPLRGAPPCPSR